MRRIVAVFIVLQLTVTGGLVMMYANTDYEVVRDLNNTGDVVHGIHDVEKNYSIQYDESLEQKPRFVNNEELDSYQSRQCGLKIENTVNLGSDFDRPISRVAQIQLDNSLISNGFNINNFETEGIVIDRVDNNDVVAKQVLCRNELDNSIKIER